MVIKLDKRFTAKAKGVFEKYSFVVGVLQDKPHKLPLKEIKSYAGGPIRRPSYKPSGKNISDVSKELREKTRINFYTKPFQSRKNKDILNFSKSLFDLCAGRTQARRCENYLQAIVRNPILRGDYGSNSRVTKKIKGFNRYMIDTAQLFKAIQAKVQRV